MVYTVKQLATLAGISTRTLHYYDEIGLLKPSSYGGNGYRYYEEKAVLRLQQILFFRELGFSLNDIQGIVDQPEFDTVQALWSHRQALQQQVRRLNNLIQTIDKTMLHLKGNFDMKPKEFFAGFDEEKEKRYAVEAGKRYGEETVKASYQRWNNYTAEQKNQIKAEGQSVYQDLLACMEQGYKSQAVQAVIGRWHQHLRYFYEPTPEILLNLGRLYSEDPEFMALYQKMHPDLPDFLRQAIEYYCQETAVLPC